MATVATLSRLSSAVSSAAAADSVRHDDARVTGAEQAANKGAANGYTPLVSSLVPAANLPAATTTTQGAIVLGGDLGGTATFPRLIANTTATKTAAYTILDTDGVIIVQPTASTTITLPTAVARSGRRFIVKKAFNFGFPVIIASNGGTIDGATTETIIVAGGFRELVSDGANWSIVGGTVVPVLNSPTAPANAGTLTVDATLASVFRLTPAVAGYTLAAPTSPVDGVQINFEFTPSVAFTLTLSAAILLTTGITTPISVASGKKAFLGLRYSGAAWYLIASTVQS